MKVRYASFDVLKGLSCLAIVFIHYNFIGDLGIAVKAMCRFAVPIFFFISGFFFLSSDYTIERDRTIRKLKHILSLTIKAGIFYAIFCIIWNFIADPNFNLLAYTNEVISKAGLFKLVVNNDPLVYAVLWFLLALIYIYLTFLPFNHKKVPKYLPYIALVLLLIYNFFALPHMYRVIPNAIEIGHSSKYIVIHNLYIFRALPFFLFGVWAKTIENEIRKFKISKLTIIFAVVIGLLLSLDARFYMGEAGYFMGSYLIVAVLAIAAIQYPNFQGKGILRYIGQYLSLYVYILHIAVGESIDLLATKLHLASMDVFVWSKAFIVLALSLILSYIVFKISQLDFKRVISLNK